MGYRPDIDGLRAIAVLAVVGFHAFPGRVEGGFIGVDVFFVISGYLITGLIGGELDAGAFSFRRFYARRARRIFPALVVVLLATLAIGWVMLLPDEFARLGEHVVAGSLFSSNFVLWHEAGYFDVKAATKPLLHLWSLGIEEQFYIVWPICAVILWRSSSKRATMVATIAAASFAFCVFESYTDVSAAFYSPLARAWELMVGAGLAMLEPPNVGPRLPKRWREAGVLGGLALIVLSAATLTPQTRFPGVLTLPAVIGTALVIRLGAASWVGRRVLAHPAAVFVGLISYPLYLWHWPLLAFVRLAVDHTGVSPLAARIGILAAVLLAVVAAIATWRFVERPARAAPSPVRTGLRAALALCVTLFIGAGVRRAPHSRLDGNPAVDRAVAARSDWHSYGVGRGVQFTTGVRGDPQVVFMGDSHAERYFPAVQQVLRSMRRPPVVAFVSAAGCAPIPTAQSKDCEENYRMGMSLAGSRSVERVVLIANWMGNVDRTFGRSPGGWTQFVDATGGPASPARVDSVFRQLAVDLVGLRRAGKDVVLLLTHPGSLAADPALLASTSRIPFIHDTTPTLAFPTSFSLLEFKTDASWIEGEVAMAARASGARLIDPAPYLCPNGACPTMDEKGNLLRSDGDHLRPFASIRYLTFLPSLLTLPAPPEALQGPSSLPNHR